MPDPKTGEAAVEPMATDRHLAEILAISSDAIISVDESHGIVIFNSGAESIFGYSAREAIGQSLEMLLPERFREAHGRHMASFVDSGSRARRMGERQQIVALSRDGREFPADASISQISVGGRRLLTVVLRDVSERVARERALARSEQRLQLALAAGEIGLFEHDHRAQRNYWSQIFRSIVGVASDLPPSLAQYIALVPETDREAVRDVIRRAHDPKGSGALLCEHRMQRPDGTKIWVSARAQVLFEGEGRRRNAIRTVGAIRDITVRKLAEEQLETSKVALTAAVAARTAELSALLNAVPDGILVTDLFGTILATNAAVCRLFGYGAGEIVGLPVESLCADHNQLAAVETAFRSWESDDPKLQVQILCKRKCGGEFPATIFGNSIVGGEGRPVSRVCIIHDVTKELARQKALDQAQRMEAVGQIAGGIAHDFNNLLTVITGNQELLAPRLEDERSRALLRRAQEAADMGARLTDRLLTFARRRPLAPANLNLNEHVTGMIELLRRSIGEAIILGTDLAPDLWQVQVDTGEIENAILNLVINARDALPSGGNVMISTGNVRVDGAHAPPAPGLSPGDYVTIAVRDDGVGMTADVKARVFEPFFTTKASGKGTGLGLSTIYQFAEQSGGGVSIDSTLNVGTVVTIYLPRAEAEALASDDAGETAGRAADFSGLKALIVEDNAGVRAVTAARLTALGFRVEEAETGSKAIDILSKAAVTFDLVLTDVVMPGGVSGYDVAQWVATHAPRLVVVLSTGFDDAAARGQAPSSARSLPLLRKPYQREDLERTLARALAARPKA